MKIILASNSPRRKELLGRLVNDFAIIGAKTEKAIEKNLNVYENVKSISLAKAKEVYLEHNKDLVIGADTIVVVDDLVLGKPKDKADALRMLKLLNNRTHSVLTGVAIMVNGDVFNYYEESFVTFRDNTNEELDKYIESMEPFDKAGAYAIQGLGGKLVKDYSGELENIVGLPLIKLSKILKEYL